MARTPIGRRTLRSTESETDAKPITLERAALSQRDKFIQAAREAECDETGEASDEALRKIGKTPRR